jgi:hypothetical protein
MDNKMLKTIIEKITGKTRQEKPVVIKRPCVRCFKQHAGPKAFCGHFCRWLWSRRNALKPGAKA